MHSIADRHATMLHRKTIAHRVRAASHSACAVLAAVLATALGAGCAAPAPPCPPPPTGVYVAVSTLESIAPGTERGTVVAMLGEPNHVLRLEADPQTPGDELWTWCCDSVEARTGRVLVLTQDEPAPTSSTARITFERGRVVRAWVESPAPVPAPPGD